MRAKCIENTNFQGKFVIENSFSNKPGRCIKKVKDNLENLVRTKDYNLYLKQNFVENRMEFSAKYPFPLNPTQTKMLLTEAKEFVPVNSKSSNYIAAANNVIKNFEDNVKKYYKKEWEDNQKAQIKEDIKDLLSSTIFFPLFAVSFILHGINPKWSDKFEKFIDKII